MKILTDFLFIVAVGSRNTKNILQVFHGCRKLCETTHCKDADGEEERTHGYEIQVSMTHSLPPAAPKLISATTPTPS
jgi:hypothetical protein